MRFELALSIVASVGMVCVTPVLGADRPAVERALTEMGQAAAAADVEGYLAHVDRSDPIFFKERENWAKDLKRKTPAAVAFTIASPKKGEKGEGVKTPEFGEKSAHFEMVTTWTMPAATAGEKENQKPAERIVSFPVVFVLGDGGKWLYAGEDWLTLESGDAEHHNEGKLDVKKDEEEKPAEQLDARPRDVRFQGPTMMPGAGAGGAKQEHRARVRHFAGYEEVARRIVEVLPLVRDHVDEGFGQPVPRVQEVKLYPSMKHLQESIYLSYVDGLSGWNEPGESIKLLTRPNAGKRGLRTLLAHEYGHVATFELGEKANDMPWWVLEGVAELSAERFSSMGKGAESSVLRWNEKNTLAKWDDLADFHKVQENSPRDLQAKVYQQGHHMLMYISERWGRDGRIAWLSAMAKGKTIDEATRAVAGMSFDELDTAWRGRVKELAAEVAAKKGEEGKDAGEKK